MYSWYAELCHLPSTLIRESWILQRAAVVATPIWKLWPKKGFASIPACNSADRIMTTNLHVALVRKDP